MLARIHEILENVGEIGPYEGWVEQVIWSRHLIVCYRSVCGSAYLIKIAPRRQNSFQREAAGLSAAERILPGSAPRLIGVTSLGEYDAMVAEYTDFRTLGRAENIAGQRPYLAQAFQLYPNFKSGSTDLDAVEYDVIRNFCKSYCPSLIRDLDQIYNFYVPKLFCFPQHGDYVLGNMGVHSGQLFVVDWEEYGRINLPGYDLAILLASIAKHDVRKINGILSDEADVWNIYTLRALEKVGLYWSDFKNLLPLYYAYFMWQKYNGGYWSTSFQPLTLIRCLLPTGR